MTRLITLTTDFGLTDTYVGALKGVILNINPAATIVDLTHAVEPQNVGQASFLLSTACPYFPRGTVHLVVVDPGVGSSRRPIVVERDGTFFVAPDNGVLSHVLAPLLAWSDEGAETTAADAVRRPLPAGCRAVALTNRRYWLEPISSTFHGRDIFAPVAARLSLGVPMLDFGEPIDSITVFPGPRPRRQADGSLLGYVVHIDRFGNVITNIRASDLSADVKMIEVAGHRIQGLSASYAEGPALLALVGSSGQIEIAAQNGSAEDRLGLQVGDIVRFVEVKAGQRGDLANRA